MCANRSALIPFDISVVDLDGNLTKQCSGPVRITTNSSSVELSGSTSGTLKGGKTVFERVIVTRLAEIDAASSLKLQVEGAKKLSGLKPAIASLSIENSEAPEAIEVTML